MFSKFGIVLALLPLMGLTGTRTAAPKPVVPFVFNATAVFDLTSVQIVGGQVLLEAEGLGASRQYGPFVAHASVIETLVTGGCDTASVEYTIEMAGGTLLLHGEDVVCGEPGGITGTWVVVGGTGLFAGATGSGIDFGTPSPTGTEPVIIHLDGVVHP